MSGGHNKKNIARPIKALDDERINVNDGQFRAAYIPKFRNAKEYADAKIDILRDHFCINLTREDEWYIRSFETESTINAAARTIINKHWDKE